MSDYEPSDSESDYSDGLCADPHRLLPPTRTRRAGRRQPSARHFTTTTTPTITTTTFPAAQLLYIEWMLHQEHNRRDWEIEMRWYLAALMAVMTPPPTPSDSEHTSSESEGVYSDEED
ncbi:unnamed protein product [Heligmosomoides polygyrus]|uniref:Uncharacterized protein n=1 Tax=Heligmosomoides polygyrus TaxID=6339 RepID=A0A183F763_HELPZ|nr:unnamed protein product [Heligmosomoides polygyrus]